MNLGALTNLDLLSVGIAISANLIIGFAVFFKDSKSATSILFLLETVVLSIWSVLNYLAYNITDLSMVLWVERFVMFFAVPIAMSFLLLSHTFPERKLSLPKRVIWGIIFIGGTTMVITLSPILFSGVEIIPGIITPQPIVGPGMIVFIPSAILSIILGFYFLIKKYVKSQGLSRLQLRYLLLGVVTMFSLVLALNFFLPAFLRNTRFIPLSAVFTLPFVALTAYAVLKHHLLNVKVITTEVLTFVLAVVSLFEVIISKDPGTLIFRVGTFALVLYFGILLIRSVLKEVEQREELQKLTGELQIANKKLDELNKFKSDMLSLASHDIKRPLATIKGFASLLIDGIYGPVTDKMKETLVKIKTSADELVALVESLLNLRRVEEGYKFEPTKLGDLIAGVVGEIKPVATEKKIELSFTSEAELTVNADPQKLKEAVKNIIDNAIKYTPTGFVKVELKNEDNFAIVVISDSGLGIPSNLLPRLFGEEFVRDERFKHEIRGTGLGLYLTGKIIEAHAGKIWAESDGEGKGSRFYVKLRKI